MSCVAFAIALLCLVSACGSAPLKCAELLRPLVNPDLSRLWGQWALVAGGLSHPPNLERFKRRDGATVNFSRNTTESTVSYTRSIRVDNTCTYDSHNVTLGAGGVITYDGTPPSNFTANFVHTSCRDCVIMRMNSHSKKLTHVYLFSRRREVERRELEEFRAQVDCLSMPPPVVMDPTKEMCPEETAEA